MAKCILKIGGNHYLLPNDQGLATILKVLSSAVECQDKRSCGGGVEVGDYQGKLDPVRVSVSMLPPGEKIVRREPYREPGTEPEPSSVVGIPEETIVLVPERPRLNGRRKTLALPAPRKQRGLFD